MSVTDILLIEDNPKLSESLCRGMQDAGFSIQTAFSGAEALARLDGLAPDLILLDLGLPDIDGLELFAQLNKKHGGVPIIIITARGSVEERVHGLNLGSDDYLVKPFAFDELLARVRAVLRRSDISSPKTVLKHGGITMDVAQRSLHLNDQPVELPPREFALLQYLLERRGQVVSRDMLARDVWKVSLRATSLDNAIDVHISRLRERLKEYALPGMLKTIRGTGFTIDKP